jgi:hypothetical protein
MRPSVGGGERPSHAQTRGWTLSHLSSKEGRDESRWLLGASVPCGSSLAKLQDVVLVI